MTPRTVGRSWLAIVVIVCAALVAGEVVAAVYYAARSGRFFYFARRSPSDAFFAEPASDVADGEPFFQVHPQFGYSVRPGVSVTQYLSRGGRDASSTIRLKTQAAELPAWASTTSNNLGFFSPHDYPTSQLRSFVVGVFGGSVAQWLVLQAGDRLAALLAGLPGLNGRPVQVLNFAQPSFKQPQQLAVLAYAIVIGQRFDLVVNIDGFNEAALAGTNHREGIEPSLPAISMTRGFETLLSASTDDVSVRYLGRLADLRSQIRREARRRARSRFALGALISDVRLRWARAQYESVAAEPPPPTSTTRLMYTTTPLVDDLGMPATVAGQWRRASRSMAALARTIDAAYVHVLQPNQYFGDRIMSPEERTIAYAEAFPYRFDVEMIYPLLVSNGRQQADVDHLAFFDLTDLFDAVDETVYSDTCCHYNQRGNEILARALFDHLRDVLGSTWDTPR